MALPGNGIFVVKGEISNMMAAMKRGTRWSSHSYQDDDVDSLLRNFQELRDILDNVDDLRFVEPNTFLAPFLNVIRSEETTGPVTSLALSAVNKFLSYGLLDPLHASIPQTIHSIADAVTHARFVGTDQSSDGVVLIRILQVLRTLTLSPEGTALTNESLCEIMLSCFRICFETRLVDLLRKTAEHYLKEMVQLIFMRLPQFSEDLKVSYIKQLKMKPGALDQTRTKRKKQYSSLKKDKSDTDIKSPQTPQGNLAAVAQSSIVDMQGSLQNPENANPVTSNASPKENFKCDVDIIVDSPVSNNEDLKNIDSISSGVEEAATEPKSLTEEEITEEQSPSTQDYINQRGIRFTPQLQQEANLSPYGLACVRELLRFLISLCNPLDKQNTEIMIHLGLTLLTVAFEISADNIGKYNTLLALVKDDLCRNLFSLMNTERLAIFSLDLQVSFLLFESLRTHLKYQLEHYLKKLIEIILSDSPKVTYEHKEIALDNLLQLWRIPGFHTELYINYDCDMYCANLYEELTKLLAKHSISSNTGVYHTHLLSLDALMIITEGIENRCCEEKDRLDAGNSELVQQSNDISFYVGKNSRTKVSPIMPKKEELAQKKSIKKWLPQGTEYFNKKPKKGIEFLQEHGVLKQDIDLDEIARFLRENPVLNKAMIGEYISNRSNLKILQSFVDTFNFVGVRIDEALRAFLETFRLPGEAPTISLILEHFAETWHKANNEPFADVDSAFTLAYAIIMLNVDQHNENAKKQTTPMSANAFKKNLKGVNGGNDFDEEMLDDIYTTIKNEEIVMPAEQAGLVRENYFWKILLRKGQTKDGIYIHDNSGTYDSELFQIVYGPIVAALSSVYEKAENESVHKKVMQGFERCAFIAANLNISTNLDMLILGICKFTVFYNQQKQNNIVVQFGMNSKAQLALRTVFSLIHQHGNTMREGWKHLFDLLLALYSNGLLSKTFVEVEDFIEPSGKLMLVYKEAPSAAKQDTGLLSSLYSYMVSAENLSKIPTPEEQNCIDAAKECIKDCNLEQMITDSKFLHEEALFELVKTLIELSRGPDVHESVAYDYNDNVTVFFLELLIKVVIQNRDRVMTVWQNVRDHIYTLVMNASVFDFQFLLERSVIGLLRIAIRLMRNEEMSHIVLQSLRMLLLLKSSTLSRISRQISFGLYELLKTSAQNIHTNTDWTIIFTLLECVGAGAQPPKPVSSAEDTELKSKSDGETSDNHEEEGTLSDSEGRKSPKDNTQRSQSPVSVVTSPVGTPNTGGWILVGNEGEIQPVMGRTVPPTQYGLALEKNLGSHDPRSMMKCCESLAFLVRDVAHITPYNFDVCVHCIRTFVEASLHGSNFKRLRDSRSRKKTLDRTRTRKSPTSSPDEDDSDDENIPSGYHQISIQLLDLMHTLHTRTAQIFKWWAEEGGEISQETSLWTQGWCPLLQGIARLCCDTRRPVRMSAITYLQRALLVHDLQTLSGSEWEQCFQRVLFPLLSYLLQSINPKDAISMEETRIRVATVLSKVFLHHLTPLLALPSFFNLWLVVLDFMDKYMHADKSELLYEAIPESLKNMLLVMDSAKVFDGPDGKNILWNATWERIGKFLPNMKDDLFKEIEDQNRKNEEVSNIEIIVNKEEKDVNTEKLTTNDNLITC
ncbi:Golgi-specific brefeldin A-resistance guanine nucleotide exchange factor 1 [Diabrotica virgifera virgifera]|uniref:SEC7 domain-containing protein n=1 Tax=Diabrotica virgifera virgifera TaxID=50390 RepID=A0ABM5JTC2_DIAVI|nr:Golgi-specific brefeldin A-resistance guanine nucleotide exchange factor 1 [Diabrotica virgifera virgifera]